jgi:AcrR family transcriptional regulator
MKERLTKDSRREQILEAAAGLLESRGFESLRTAELARAAGVSEALLFRHFRDKEDLLFQAANRVILDFFRRRGSSAGTTDPGTLADELAAFAERQGREGLRRWYALFFQSLVRYPETLAETLNIVREHRRLLNDLFGGDPWILMAAMEGALLVWTLSPDMDLADSLRRVLEACRPDAGRKGALPLDTIGASVPG